MSNTVSGTIRALLSAVCIAVGATSVSAQEAPTPSPAAAKPAKKEPAKIAIGYLRAYAPRLALSLLDVPPENDGIAGANAGIDDNNTTGKFLNQDFTLDIAQIKPEEDPIAALDELIAKGNNYILADLSAPQLLAAADHARAKGVLIFNIGATDDSLREQDCRANVFHIAPTRSMLADALGQYLMWKRWPKWALVEGSHPNDKLFADALRRTATTFGAQIVGEKVFEDTGTARRSDTGIVQIQKLISVFTQDIPEHDILLVADESEVFGSYVPFRTWLPRPVAGTAGLIPSSWHAASEQWAGTQMQNRFVKAFSRGMTSKDMSAWVAIRAVGESATRAGNLDLANMTAYLKSDKFSVAAFKGQKLTFRDWNQQLRQPIFLGDSKTVITTSPQEGYLHQFTELDTLGVDRPQTACSLK